MAQRELHGWARQDALSAAVTRAAAKDIPKAAALITAIPPSGPLLRATEDLTGQWVKQDWPAAREWMDTLEDTPTRRTAWKALSASAPPEQAALVQGEIHADHVIINGTVRGPVHARELLELQPKANITGDVSYRALEMHQGAVITGQLRPLVPAGSEEEKPLLKLAANNL